MSNLHSHAFLGAGNGDVAVRLQASDGVPAIRQHCLARLINHRNGLAEWAQRIRLVPDYYIDEVLTAASAVGLPPANRDACAAFLKNRRNTLEAIVNNNLQSFPHLPVIH